ncbi:MAG: hypothetical protein IPL31_04140 [Saprospiraceae bacterium]|nr:hypothetical protein [Saprospiraceae bacterium]
MFVSIPQYLQQQRDSLVITDIRFTPADTSISNLFTCNPSNVGIDTLIFTKPTPASSVVFQTTTCYLVGHDHNFNDFLFACYGRIGYFNFNNTLGCDSVILNTSYAPLRLNYQLDSINCF